jgi:hypothetical protein
MTSTTNRPLRDRYGSFADAEEYMIRTLRAVTTTTASTAPNNNHNNSTSHPQLYPRTFGCNDSGLRGRVQAAE